MHLREAIPVQVILDVQQFAPSEITVKTLDNTVIVEGKHEEKQDEHGYVSRHFVRRYILPSDIEVNNIVSSLSSDGVLTVTAPKKVELMSVISHRHLFNAHLFLLYVLLNMVMSVKICVLWGMISWCLVAVSIFRLEE
jgi:hypothetical protein